MQTFKEAFLIFYFNILDFWRILINGRLCNWKLFSHRILLRKAEKYNVISFERFLNKLKCCCVVVNLADQAMQFVVTMQKSGLYFECEVRGGNFFLLKQHILSSLETFLTLWLRNVLLKVIFMLAARSTRTTQVLPHL